MKPEDPGDKVTDGLVGEIEASPEDEGPQLVIADWLQSQGDPRGELIILAHREKSGGELDPAALERLLWFPFDPDPLPTYDGGPRRAYRVPVDFCTRYGLHHTRYGIAARDLHRWLAIWGRLRSEL